MVDKPTPTIVINKIREVLERYGVNLPPSIDLDFNMIDYNIESIVILSTISEVEASLNLEFDMAEFERRNFILTIGNILHCLS